MESSPLLSKSYKFQQKTPSKLKRPPNVWLKDLTPIEGSHPTSGGGPTNAITVTQDSFLMTTENDLDLLVQFEEELERKGNYNLIFPLK